MKPISNVDPIRSSVVRVNDTTESSIRSTLGERTFETLIAEIRRYLAVVEVFRGEGCEPRWM
jgi:hypothetical protein